MALPWDILLPMDTKRDHHGLGEADLATALDQHGIHPTPQRVKIAAILMAAPQHLSADQILTLVNQGGYRVSKATVYNTLALFGECGLVREVIVDPAKVFYDSNTRPHHHFYNVDTGMLTDFDAGELSVAQMPLPPEGTVAEGLDIVIRVRNQRC